MPRDTYILYWLVSYRLDTTKAGQDMSKIFWSFKNEVTKKVDKEKASFKSVLEPSFFAEKNGVF